MVFNLKTFFQSLLIGVVCFFACDDLGVLSPEKEGEVFYKNINLNNQDSPKTHYTFLTFNIHKGFGLPPEDPPRNGGNEQHFLKLVDAIKSVEPDFVALQEVVQGKFNATIQNQIEFLAQHLDMNYAFGPARTERNLIFEDGLTGNAILSRYKILNVVNSSIDKNEERSCLHLDVEITDNIYLTILNAHLWPIPANAADFQFANVLAIADMKTHPTVIMGDFNAHERSTHVLRVNEKYPDTFLQIEDEDSQTIRKHGTYLPKRFRIDYIFTESAFFEVLDIGLLPDEYWDVSDHVGYHTMITFK